MGWTNQQATTLDGQSFTYTNTTVDYSTGSALTVDNGATFTVGAGSTLSVADIGGLTIDGHAPALGVVGRNYASSDQPAAGTTAGSPSVAATVLTVTAPVTAGRIYLVSAPAISVRANVDSLTSGVQFTYTTDGTTPLNTSTLLASNTVTSRYAGVPEDASFAATFRPVASGTFRVLLSVWQIGTSATVVSGGNHGGDPKGVIELLVTDLGVDPGVTP